uniref:hypothetical protein n=1 Tax=Rhodococcus opacus TaxID=37919 RepID=UPI001D00CC5A|nr:hypothetical protein [Rhodococcus opacus]
MTTQPQRPLDPLLVIGEFGRDLAQRIREHRCELLCRHVLAGSLGIAEAVIDAVSGSRDHGLTVLM